MVENADDILTRTYAVSAIIISAPRGAGRSTINPPRFA